MKKRIKDLFFIKPVLITILTLFIFAALTAIEAYIRLNLNFSYFRLQLIDMVYSLIVILFCLLIIKKWFSFKEIGLQRSGFRRSLFYSLLFVFLLIIFDYKNFGSLRNINWNKDLISHLLLFIPLAFQDELIFRGIIFRSWLRSKRFLLAMFVSSMLFGLEHLLYPVLGKGDLTASTFVSTALFGPVWVLIAYRTNNLWGLAISHFIYNSLISSFQLSADSVPENNFVFIMSVSVYLLLPVVIDYFEKIVLKIKEPVIIWSRYFAVFFIFGWSMMVFSSYFENDLDIPSLSLDPYAIENAFGKSLPSKEYPYVISQETVTITPPKTEISLKNGSYSSQIKDLPKIQPDSVIFKPINKEAGVPFEDLKREQIAKYGNLARRFIIPDKEEVDCAAVDEYVSNITKADVDQDGEEEQIVNFYTLGANPWETRSLILKNDKIIFTAGCKVPFPNIVPASVGSGFYLEWGDNFKKREGYVKTRFVYKNGEFMPVFEQKVRYKIKIDGNEKI